MSEEVSWRGGENLGLKQLSSKAKDGQAPFYFNVSCVTHQFVLP